MPTGNKGLINHISNMVAPQVSGSNYNNNSTWKIVKSKKQLKEERKWKNDKAFPPLPVLSSASKNGDNSNDESRNSSKSPKPSKTSTKKPSIKIRKLIRDMNEIKTGHPKSQEPDKDKDDMSTVSSSSFEGYFSSSSSSEESTEEEIKMAKRTALRIKRKQEKLNKKHQEDMELDKIIKRIENEHIIIEDTPTNKTQPKPKGGPIKIKQEEDSDFFEYAFSAKTMPESNIREMNLKQASDHQNIQENVNQEQLKHIKEEMDILQEINTNSESVNFYVNQEDTFQQDEIIFEIAMDMSHIKDKEDYSSHINTKLPRLHDQIFPSSLREIAFLGPMLDVSISDWTVDGIERGVELERIENSMFFHQLKLHGMDHSFKQLFEDLHLIWDEYGIPYSKRKKLLLVEIEMVSLLMCDVLPSNYGEQGIWVGDESQGQYYQFFKDKNVDSGRKKWLDLLGITTYKWFWQVYTNTVSLSTLNDEEIVMMNDLFEIVTFIHPPAIRMLLSNTSMLQKFNDIKEKARIKSSWVETRHHLYYLWYFYGFQTLPNSYPSYDSTKNNLLSNTTRWISKLMTLDQFFNEYQHFYLIEEENEENQYFLYESPPTYEYNWQWEADPREFNKKTKLYNGVRAANLSRICCPPKLQSQSRERREKLIQGVLLRGKHNRMYHHDFRQKFPGKTYQQSAELPVDWLIYYDSLSRVSRDPTELYSFKLFSVPYLILRDQTKRESYYHEATRDFTRDELIPSNRLEITICHSENTTNFSTNNTLLRRNIFIPNIRQPFILNNIPTENLHTDGTGSTRRTYTYFYGKDHTLQNLPYIRELSFSNSLFKNIYYQSTQHDLKNIVHKIGREDDPLFAHPYFQLIIKSKQQQFEKNGSKFIEAGYEPVVESTATGSTLLNKSTAHFEERGDNLNNREMPILKCSNSNKFKNSRYGTNFKLPAAPVNNLKRQTAVGVSLSPDWWRWFSRRTHADLPYDPMTFVPQDVSQAFSPSQDLCPYSDDELESAESLRTLKVANIHTRSHPIHDGTDIEPGYDTDPVGLRYMRKRTNSDVGTEISGSAQEQGSVSKYLRKNIRRVRSLNDLTQNCIHFTYEYAYATVAGTEATTDVPKHEPSVVTYDSEKPRTKNLDSTTNKLKESILKYENDTISSSNILTNVDIDNSIVKLTNQMKKNFITAKADSDKYVKINLQPTKSIEKDSITAKESQIKDLLTESNDNNTSENNIHTDIMEQNIENLKGEISSNHSLKQDSIPQQLDENSFSDDSLSKILSINPTENNLIDVIYPDSSDNPSSSSSSSSTQSTNNGSLTSQGFLTSDSSSTSYPKSHKEKQPNN